MLLAFVPIAHKYLSWIRAKAGGEAARRGIGKRERDIIDVWSIIQAKAQNGSLVHANSDLVADKL